MTVLTGSVRLWQVIVLAVIFGIFSAVDNPATPPSSSPPILTTAAG